MLPREASSMHREWLLRPEPGDLSEAYTEKQDTRVFNDLPAPTQLRPLREECEFQEGGQRTGPTSTLLPSLHARPQPRREAAKSPP